MGNQTLWNEVVGVAILAAFVLPIGWVIWRWWDKVVEWINDLFQTVRFIILLPFWILKAVFYLLTAPIFLLYVLWQEKQEEKRIARQKEIMELTQTMRAEIRSIIREEIQMAIERNSSN